MSGEPLLLPPANPETIISAITWELSRVRRENAALRARVADLETVANVYSSNLETFAHLLGAALIPANDPKSCRQNCHNVFDSIYRKLNDLHAATRTNSVIGTGRPLESPLEQIFEEAWLEGAAGLVLHRQYEVFDGRYRLDFAHTPTKTAVECDGFTYHSGDAAFERDRQRDRELTRDGWAVLRFGGGELRYSPGGCARQVIEVILARRQGANR